MKDKVVQGEISLVHVPSKDMIADSLTKPIAPEVYAQHVLAMSLYEFEKFCNYCDICTDSFDEIQLFYSNLLCLKY